MLSHHEIRRYSRQLILTDIEDEGQRNIGASTVVVIGLGGLGALSARYLVGAGVGNITLVDGDIVDISNLQRQVIYNEMHLGDLKAKALCTELKKVNPHVNVQFKSLYADSKNLLSIIEGATCVLDCSDTIETRKCINQACIEAEKPLFIAAASGLTWQGLNVSKQQENCGCYACLVELVEVPDNCMNHGILGPVVGMAACHQATQALLFLAKGFQANIKWGQYIHCHTAHCTVRSFALFPSSHCEVCR